MSLGGRHGRPRAGLLGRAYVGGLLGREIFTSVPVPVLTSITPITYASVQQYDGPVLIEATGANFTVASVIREGGPGGVELPTTYLSETKLRATTLGAHRSGSVFAASGARPFDVLAGPASSTKSGTASLTVAAFAADAAETMRFTGDTAANVQRSSGRLTRWINEAYGGGYFDLDPNENTGVVVTDNDPELGAGTKTTITMPGNRYLYSTHAISAVMGQAPRFGFCSVAKMAGTFNAALIWHGLDSWWLAPTGTVNTRACFNGTTHTATLPFAQNTWSVFTFAMENVSGVYTLRLTIGRAGVVPATASVNVTNLSTAGNGGIAMRVGNKDAAYMTGKVAEVRGVNGYLSEREMLQWTNRMYQRHGFAY